MRTTLVPVLTDNGSTLFPGMRCGVIIGCECEHEALRLAFRRPDRMAGVFARRDDSDALYDIGVLAEVESLFRHQGRWIAIFRGVARVGAVSWERDGTGVRADCAPLIDPREPAARLEALATAIARIARRHYERFPATDHTRRTIERLERGIEPSRYPGAVGDLLLHLAIAERQQLLEVSPLSARLEATLLALRDRRPSPRDAFA